MKNSVEGLINRVTATEDKTSNLEDQMQETSRHQHKMKKCLKNKQTADKRTLG